jgi:hypothetical protein
LDLDATGPAAGACGVADSAEAARRAAGSLLASRQARVARVEQAAMVIESAALTYDYCPTGRAWNARPESGSPVWVPDIPLPGRAAS